MPVDTIKGKGREKGVNFTFAYSSRNVIILGAMRPITQETTNYRKRKGRGGGGPKKNKKKPLAATLIEKMMVEAKRDPVLGGFRPKDPSTGKTEERGGLTVEITFTCLKNAIGKKTARRKEMWRGERGEGRMLSNVNFKFFYGRESRKKSSVKKYEVGGMTKGNKKETASRQAEGEGQKKTGVTKKRVTVLGAEVKKGLRKNLKRHRKRVYKGTRKGSVSTETGPMQGGRQSRGAGLKHRHSPANASKGQKAGEGGLPARANGHVQKEGKKGTRNRKHLGGAKGFEEKEKVTNKDVEVWEKPNTQRVGGTRRGAGRAERALRKLWDKKKRIHRKTWWASGAQGGGNRALRQKQNTKGGSREKNVLRTL